MQNAVEIDLTDKIADTLGKLILSRWNNCVWQRSAEKISGKSINEVLMECYEQREGILPACDRQFVAELGTDYYVNISGLKVSALVAWLRDLLVNTNELPFRVDPTPIPELSDISKRKVLQEVKQKLLLENFDGDLVELIKYLKNTYKEKQDEFARNASEEMNVLIQDQCVEGGFRNALLEFLEDFATYPYAVMHGPLPEKRAVVEWAGDTLKTVINTQLVFRSVDVFDFFWMSDCKDAQSGTGVFIRERLSKQQLYECADMDSYIRENVIAVLKAVASGRQILDWTSRKPDDIEKQIFGWQNGGTLEVLRHYGSLAGKELKKVGITGVEDEQQYETCISIVDDKVIQAYVLPNPGLHIRPVYVTSFEKVGKKIPGVSICQKVRDVERCYMQALRFMMVNAGFAAGPVGEVDTSRISKYLEPEDVGKLQALTMYPVDSAMLSNDSPAYRVYNLPVNIGVFASLEQFFMDLADRITQIPASIHGEPVGTGANRTFRGMAMLYGNALKPIQAAVGNMDKDIFSKAGESMYYYNMKFSDNSDIKGDAKVVARGATGLLAKEIEQQAASETLQLVAQAASAIQAMDPRIIEWALNKLLSARGVPVEQITGRSTAVAMPTRQAVEQGIGQSMPGADITAQGGIV